MTLSLAELLSWPMSQSVRRSIRRERAQRFLALELSHRSNMGTPEPVHSFFLHLSFVMLSRMRQLILRWHGHDNRFAANLFLASSKSRGAGLKDLARGFHLCTE